MDNIIVNRLDRQNMQNNGKHLSSPPVFNGVRVTLSLVLCVMCCRSLVVLFPWTIVLSALLRFMDSEYPFGIFKLFSVTTQK